jgi:hypothetical protein
MKKLLLLLLATASLTAQAQHADYKKTTRKARKTHIQKVTLKKYHSRNGSIKAHEMSRNEVIDANQKKEINAPHVNSNYNESVPALSPSNGSGNK